MTTTLSWRINSIATHPTQIDGEDNVVVQVVYQRVATNGEREAADLRPTLIFDPAELSGPFTPFADLTEADVIGWIEAHEAADLTEGENPVTKLSLMDASLAAQVEAVNTEPVPVDLPWANAVEE